ncbi:hypothetical protein WG66_013701 [Moniliophthora roreri]|nr:hypothetical protein WG66_013701 [Moniliophthora roreri]
MDLVKVRKFGDKLPGAVKLCAYSYEITAGTPQIPVIPGPGDHGNNGNHHRHGEKPNSTSTTTPSGSDPSASTKLSGGDIAGIVVGIVGFLGFLLLGLYLVYRRLRHRKRVEAFHRERMVSQQAQTQTFRVSSPTTNQLSHIQKGNLGPDPSTSFLTLPKDKEGFGQKSAVDGSSAPVPES